jgi:hypothetical protein
MAKKRRHHEHADLDTVRGCMGCTLVDAVRDLLLAHKPSVDDLEPSDRRLLAVQALTLAILNVATSDQDEWLFDDELE